MPCLPCVQDLGAAVNAAKAEIETVTEHLNARKPASSTDKDLGVLDDEHYQLLQQLRTAKSR